VVFLSHAGTQRISGGLGHQFTLWGEAAVDVFFVVSGFVIAHAASGRSARDYATARVARLASVVLPCLAVGWVLDLAAPPLGPEVYAAEPRFEGPVGGWQLLSSLLFLDHVWFRAVQPGSNLPFWSLCFEAFYYLAFGLALFLQRPWNWPGAAVVLLAAGPKIALLAPLWALGVACRSICAAGGLPRSAGWILLAAPLVLVLVLWEPGERSCFPFMPFTGEAGCLADLGHDYVVGVLFALQILGVHALAPVLEPWLRPIARPVAWLAGASFTFYLLHYPLLHALAAASPWAASHWGTRALVFLVPPLAALALAAVTERRRAAWRRAAGALIGRAA
jgi:peptidoglycan/LPS O-acetylase OafA/YrhL